MRKMLSFDVKEVLSVKRGGWYYKIKKSEKLKLGEAPMDLPNIFKKTQASKLGVAQGIPFFFNKLSGHL